MKLLEIGKSLATDSEVQEGTKNFLEDCISALLGDHVAIGKITVSLANSPFFLNEKIFWQKFELFLSGVDMEDNDRAEFCKRLTEDGTKKENPYILIQAINRAETRQKIIYLINASRSLSAKFIDLPIYFRMCNAITNALPEDLEFLAEHITDKEEYSHNDTVQRLINTELMQSDGKTYYNSRSVYKFTQFANLLDKFAISFNNVDRYPMINESPQSHERKIRQEIEQME